MFSLPVVNTIKNYSSNDFKGDLRAGLTTAVMLVPQAMAYAMLAGLDPIVGLYASTIPTMIYALLGSSRQLAVGPVALDSMLVALTVAPLAQDNPVLYAQYATVLMLLVGGIQFVLGVSKLGKLADWISPAVLSGFTSAAAILIAFAQVPHILGIKVPSLSHFHEKIGYLLLNLSQTQYLPLTIGLLGVVLLSVITKKNPNFPRHLVVIVLGTLATVAGGLEGMGLAVVGDVPQGFPSFVAPLWDVSLFAQLFFSACIIAFIAFMEAFAVGSKVAEKEGVSIDANQELIALGSANIGGSFFQAYPITGGFSRTSVNYQAGAKTTIAGFITALVIVVVLMFLTAPLYYIPKAVLAAIIITAVSSLFQWEPMHKAYKENMPDFVLLMGTFLATILIGVQVGIFLGLALQLLRTIWYRFTNFRTSMVTRNE